MSSRQLAAARAELLPGRAVDIVVELSGNEVSVELDGAPTASAQVATTAPGRLGVSAWGDTFRLDGLTIVTEAGTLLVEPDDPGTPEERALAALALAALNLNEFVYVD